MKFILFLTNNDTNNLFSRKMSFIVSQFHKPGVVLAAVLKMVVAVVVVVVAMVVVVVVDVAELMRAIVWLLHFVVEQHVDKQELELKNYKNSECINSQ